MLCHSGHYNILDFIEINILYTSGLVLVSFLFLIISSYLNILLFNFTKENKNVNKFNNIHKLIFIIHFILIVFSLITFLRIT